tara:strand:+ start:10468 stop:11271 length:804 start_codon:yes stop_codon:yes gene_type:complete
LTNKNVQTASNTPSQHAGGITIKSRQELDHMRLAGQITGAALKKLREAVVPGITTKELDRIAEKEIRSLGAKPAFKGYMGFPGTICASVNEEIVHGIPGKRVLQEGDLFKVDCGATINGFIGDSALSLQVGNVSPEVQHLSQITQKALYAGIEQATVGNRIGDIGAAVQALANEYGFGLVRGYTGHGVGRFLHEEPQVPNYGKPGRGIILKAGMCIAIEPMFNLGTDETLLLDDQWTVVTADGSVSSHFEHTIAITEDGPEILTINE